MKKLIVFLFLSTSILYSQRQGGPGPSAGNAGQNDFSIQSVILPNADNYDVFLSYKIPYSSLIFLKDNGAFKAGLSLSIELSDDDGNLIQRKSSDKTVSVSYYEETESSDLFVEGLINFSLPAGEYNYVPIINLRNTKDFIKLRRNDLVIQSKDYTNFLPPLVVIPSQKNSRNNFRLFNVNRSIPYSSRKYDLIIPLKDISINEISVKVIQNNIEIINRKVSSVVKSTFTVTENNNGIFLSESNNGIELNLFELENVNKELDEGICEVEVKGSDTTVSFKLNVNWVNKPRTLMNDRFAIELLDVVEPKDTVYKLLDYSSNEYYEALKDYWKRRDPIKETTFNELMNEYYRRADYAVTNFLNRGKQTSTLSDRGRVYIKYGSPDHVERKNSDVYDIIEIWNYDNLNKSFRFADMTGLGDYVLISSK